MTLLLLTGLLGLQLFFLVNLQFTAWPEMLSYPYLRNEGFLLYKDMIHPYPPLLTMFLSLVYKFFGYDLWVVKTVAWSIILLSSALLYYVIGYVTKSRVLALLGLAFYVLLQPFLEGNMLWFDMAIVPPILLGTYFALRWREEKQDNFLLYSSFFLSVAALTKQTAALFLLILGLYVVFRGVTRGRLLNLVIPPVILLVLLVFRLMQEGAFTDFLNWTILYPLGEWSSFPGYVQMSLSTRQLAVIIILLAPIVTLNIVRRKMFTDSSSALPALFLVVSLVLVYPRFSYFHFQLPLTFIVLNLALLAKVWNARKGVLLFGAIALLLIPFVHKAVFISDWQKEVRFYGKNDTDLAGRIVDLADPEDRVFLLGLHSGLYVIADRLPPKRWTDNFGWYLEIPGVQEEILSRWENPPDGGPPAYVFWRQPSTGNWFDLGVYQPKKIVEYLQNHYNFESELVPGVQIWKRKG